MTIDVIVYNSQILKFVIKKILVGKFSYLLCYSFSFSTMFSTGLDRFSKVHETYF